MRFSFNFYSLFFLLFCLTSCGQDNKNSDAVEKPINTLKIQSANPYEIYLNGMPVEKYYSNESSSSEIPLNDFILEGGNQLLEVVLLPNKDKTEVDKLGMDNFEVKLYKYSEGLSNISNENGLLLTSIDFKNELKELPIIKKTINIDLEVSYTINGWKNSVNLKNENQETLLKEVLEKYEQVRESINQGDFEGFEKLYSKKNIETYESYYNNQEVIKEDKNWMRERIVKSKHNMLPITDYKLIYYSNGKVIALENKNRESPLIANINNFEEVYSILLHRPKAGAPLEKLVLL